MKILVVDDDALFRTLMRQILELTGDCEVVEAANGELAWGFLRDPAHQFDAMFLDIIMPEVNGMDLLQRIRSSRATQKLPVIMCTSSNDRATVQKALSAGVRHYIVKPPKPEIVLAKLQQAIGAPVA